MHVRPLALLLLLPLACTAPVGVSGLEVPADGLDQCASQCGAMGLQTTAVVAMAGRIGCVCEPSSTAGSSATSSAAIAGGMAAIVTEEAEGEHHSEQQRMMQSR